MEARIEMIKYNLTQEEKKIEEEIDNLRTVSKEKKERIEKIIERAKKDKAISLRISSYDLEKIKEKAQEEGVPYQTLINMVLHKYVMNRLIEKEELIKMIKVLKEKEVI